MIKVDCDKCSGKGSIDGFGHIENGRCFRCGGNRVFMVDAKKHAADIARTEADRAFGRLDSALVAWTGGYGSAEQVAEMIIAYGRDDIRGHVAYYLQGDARMRAELVTAYRRAKSAA
jgi:hypothetical protein